MEKKRRTEIAELGEFGLIDLLTRGVRPGGRFDAPRRGRHAAVVMPPSGEAVLCSTDALLEGIDFDLTYFPLRHLGYKAVTVAAKRYPGDERTALATDGVARCVVQAVGGGVAGAVRGNCLRMQGSRGSTSWGAIRRLR